MLTKVPLNSLQKLPDKTVNGRTVLIGTTPVIIYTVPTNKKIKVTSFSLRFDNEGANGNMYGRCGTSGAVQFTSVTAATTPQTNATDYLQNQVFTAGQDIRLVGDNAGNNGEADYNLTYQELPA